MALRRQGAIVFILALAALPLAASAQDEVVTVTGEAPTRTEIMRGFIQSYAAPSKVLGKIARWQDPICPFATGLTPEQNMAVAERVKHIAAAVGAPVRPETGCRPNLVVIFALDPKKFMTDIAAQYDIARKVLGDVDGPMHARLVSKINSPVQAWYGTFIQDVNGERIRTDCYGCQYQSNGSRLSNGVSSVFRSVFVVVDLSKAVGYEVGSMADYVAMLALSQTKTFDACRGLPSITNLLTPGCGDGLRAKTLSEADLAYLRGVYKMSADEGLNLARGDILNEMEKSPVALDVPEK